MKSMFDLVKKVLGIESKNEMHIIFNTVFQNFMKTNSKELLYYALKLAISSSILLTSELALPVFILYLAKYLVPENTSKEEQGIQFIILYSISTQINNNLKELSHLCAQELGDKVSHLIYLEGLDKLNQSPLASRSAFKDADQTSSFLMTCEAIEYVVTSIASMLVPLYISQRTLFDSDPNNNNIAYINLSIILAKLFLVKLTSSKLDKYQDKVQKSISDLLAYNNDMLRGHKLILSENLFVKEISRSIIHFNKRYEASTEKNRYLFLINTGIDTLSLLPLFYIFYQVAITKNIAGSDYLTILNGLLAANSASKNINVAYLNSKILFNCMNRLIPIFTQKPETTPSKISYIESIESIEFQDVFYKSPDQKNILENVSFRINLGEIIAFSGKSGAGKSTIFNLLQQHIYPTSGIILINNIPLTEFSPSEIRKKITYVASDTFIFNRPLIDVIRYGLPETVSLEAINMEINHVGLGEKISKLPNGINTVIQNNGQGELSGGERQLIHLVRAFLKDNRNLLILDEAVNSIDEDKLTRIINPTLCDKKQNQNRITMLISHDSKNIANVDRILHVENKQVHEINRRFYRNNSALRGAQLFKACTKLVVDDKDKPTRRHSFESIGYM